MYRTGNQYQEKTGKNRFTYLTIPSTPPNKLTHVRFQEHNVNPLSTSGRGQKAEHVPIRKVDYASQNEEVHFCACGS